LSNHWLELKEMPLVQPYHEDGGGRGQVAVVVDEVVIGGEVIAVAVAMPEPPVSCMVLEMKRR